MSPASETPTLVWDLPLRLFHWLIVLNLLGSWVFAEAGFDYFQYHIYCGYSALVLVGFRLVWGFVGSQHARFASFLRGPKAVLADLRGLTSRAPSDAIGHTPSGGWSAVVLLTLITTQATTGLFISDDIFYAGPYNAAVSSDTAGMLANLHHINFTLLQIAVVLHIAAAIWYTWGKRTPIIRAMFTGVKPLPAAAPAQHAVTSRLWLAAVVLLAACGAVWLLVNLAPPPRAMF